MSDPTHSPAPWIYDADACAIRYQLPAGHPERYSDDPEIDDGWHNVVSLRGACGGVDGNTDVELMTAAPALLAALLAVLPYAESRFEDMADEHADLTLAETRAIEISASHAAIMKAASAINAAVAAIAAATTAVRHG
jgi:hypothetical protein